MKSILLFLAGFLIVLNSNGQNFKKIDDSEANSKKVLIAQKFANDYLTKVKNGSYYEFKDDAIDAVKNGLTEQSQKAVYEQLKAQVGDFKLLVYSETWIQEGNSTIKIFRFKGDFEKSNKKLEIRVVLNSDDKIAGFWIKPWSDMLK